jgi:two-component system, cell cycle response regulator DivK
MNILVVEDNPSHLKLMSVVLKAAGNSVSCVETAEETFAAIHREQPQIILLDLTLPGLDGLTLVRRLKADPDSRLIPIVAVTAFPDLWGRQNALDAGCDEYLLKPVDTRSLAGRLAAIAGAAGHGMN